MEGKAVVCSWEGPGGGAAPAQQWSDQSQSHSYLPPWPWPWGPATVALHLPTGPGALMESHCTCGAQQFWGHASEQVILFFAAPVKQPYIRELGD